MSESADAPRKYRDRLYEVVREEIPFEEKARRALELGTEYLGADNGYLTRIDQESDHWEALVSTDSEDGPVPAGLELDLGTTYCERTVESNSQVVLDDAEKQGWSEEIAYATYGLSCYLGTTLVVGGEDYGTVCFAADEPREEPFTEDETMFAELITRLLERELERDQHEAAFRRQVNLSTVLNRVLRHNLRNDMAVIRGRTQLMAEQLEDDTDGEVALRNIDKLIGLGEKARELEQVIGETSERKSVTLATLLDSVTKQVQKSYPEASITVECEETLSVSVFDSFEHALRELIENAAKHSGEAPTVQVTAVEDDEGITIEVADDGPGLSSQEQDVLHDGAEKPLVHGSGLGLWLVNWVVTGHEGTIAATVTEEGTTMTVSLPRVPNSNQAAAEPEVTRSIDQYQAAFEKANDAMVITDDTGRILDANTAAAEIYALNRKAILGRSIQEFFPDNFEFEAEWNEFQTGTKLRDTVTIQDAVGHEHSIEYAGTPDVVPGQHLFIARDITAREEQEAELRMKTEAIDAAPIGITITDPTQEDNPMIYVNDKFCELSGYDRDEILGRNCRFMQAGLSQKESIDAIRNAIDANEPVSTTVRNVKKDGTEFWNLVTIAPVKDKTGDVQNWIGFQQDVTEQRQRKEELKQTTERLESIVAAAPNPILAVDTDGRITHWNEATEEVFGYAASEVVGKSVSELELHSSEQQKAFKEHLRRALNGEQIDDLGAQGHTKSGDIVHLKLVPILLRDSTGAPTGLLVVATEQPDSEPVNA
ncbi:PAS domain S-box protein [Halonotius sp. GCM10025705]|uniref:PAS domain S-box protein n=1 Tax=Halonotius sp. GCM10025705 TaxID=3252678 RepID=UPI00362377FF